MNNHRNTKDLAQRRKHQFANSAAPHSKVQVEKVCLIFPAQRGNTQESQDKDNTAGNEPALAARIDHADRRSSRNFLPGGRELRHYPAHSPGMLEAAGT